MRSTTSRRLHPRPVGHLVRPARPRGQAEEHLRTVAHLIDEATRGEEHHVAAHALVEGGDVVLGLLPLEPGSHPFTALAGTTAPEEWEVFGVRVQGTARPLDGGSEQQSTTTFVVDRSSAEWSVMRTDGDLTDLPGPAVGTIPDLCRRVLGLATDPPPPSTALVFALVWVDRAVDAWGDPVLRHLADSWPGLAALHPAVDGIDDPASLAEPAVLVDAARHQAATWPWSRLRAEPDALLLPEGSRLPPEVTAWMDDGFFARWAIGAFPPAPDLVHDLAGLVAPEVRPPLLEALTSILS